MSLKIGLLTFHRAYNYGAVLQCYALKEFLNKNHYTCDVIDYWPKWFKDIYYLRCQRSLRHPHINYSLKRFKIRKILNQRNRAFENFLEKNILTSKKTFVSKEEMTESKLSYDVFLTGSDQVWSDTCADFDEVYFLQFPAASGKRRCSYAASFGITSIPETLKEEYQTRLSTFDAISVRELNGANLVEAIVQKKAVVNCDPTLLLDAEQWRTVSAQVEIPDKKYIFVYYVTDGKTVRKYAKELSDKTGLQVISVPCRIDYEGLSAFEDRSYGFQVVPDCAPEAFLAFIDHAEYVVTNSFHGTVFSLIFHKQFVSQLLLDTGAVNHRAQELLEKTGLMGRALGQDQIDNKINWEIVEQVIHKERKKSLEYFDKEMVTKL